MEQPAQTIIIEKPFRQHPSSVITGKVMQKFSRLQKKILAKIRLLYIFKMNEFNILVVVEQMEIIALRK